MSYVRESGVAGGGSVYNARTSRPNWQNKYFILREYGGYNNCIQGSPQPTGGTGNAMANCVGYAIGRFNEVIGNNGNNWISLRGNAVQLYDSAIECGMAVGKTPALGAMVVWAYGEYGHVAIVEGVNSDGTIMISESNWEASGNGIFWYGQINPKNYYGMTLRGYIYNPSTTNGSLVRAMSEDEILQNYNLSKGGAYTGPQYDYTRKTLQKKKVYKEIETEIKTTKLNTYEGDLDKTKGANLLSYPSLIETPFIVVKIGDYTFGYPTRTGTLQEGNLKIDYPNYIQSLNIVKVNGTVNQYTINMVYQIQKGDDPNKLDKIFSKVGYGKIKISYGDWSSPTFIYKEEEAIITKLASNIDFANSRITYTVSCTSNALSILSCSFNFPARKAKPSDIIMDMLWGSKDYGLLDVFYGMKSKENIMSLGYITTDDKEVEIPAKTATDPLSYINYLITYMSANTNTGDGPIKDSSYYLSIHDDTYGTNNLNGPYFKITKVKSKTKTLATADTYEVDIGYPSNNLVMSFKLSDDNSWSLLYDYADKVNDSNYTYKIDDNGNVVSEYSPALTTTVGSNKTTEAQKSWWTSMTQFPVNATLVIKGLVRPAMLMTYIRINALFYGERHISSGLYIITKQTDTIDSTGYRTTLNLTRIAGDNDWFETTTEKVKTKVAVYDSDTSQKQTVEKNISNLQETYDVTKTGYMAMNRTGW